MPDLCDFCKAFRIERLFGAGRIDYKSSIVELRHSVQTGCRLCQFFHDVLLSAQGAGGLNDIVNSGVENIIIWGGFDGQQFDNIRFPTSIVIEGDSLSDDISLHGSASLYADEGEKVPLSVLHIRDVTSIQMTRRV